MFTININKLKVYTKIGVSLKERKQNQLLFVSLRFSYKVGKKKDVNDINNLKSYSDIIKSLKKYIESSRYKTLEKLIIGCSNILRKKHKIKNILIEIEKPKISKQFKAQSISVSK